MKINIRTKTINGVKLSTIAIASKRFSDSIEDATSDRALDFIRDSVNRASEYELTYKEFIKEQVKGLEPGEARPADLRGKSVSEYRVAVSTLQRETGIPYATKTIDGVLYIGRR